MRALTLFKDPGFDRFLDEVFKGNAASSALSDSRGFVPVVEVEEDENRYLLTLDVPGVKQDDIKIEVHNNEMTVSGERRTESKSKDKEGLLFSERSYGSFTRSFKLGQSVNPDAIEAQHKDGVLYITLPKAEASKPRQIRIGAGGKQIES